jgi:3-hydroxyisobutyrate dehydrogenase-like beta-hydroxyacid dehydrogenase
VLWASEGRTAASRARADAAGLVDACTVAGLVERASVVFSVCPPGSAREVASLVASCGFRGGYVDLNAVSPGTTAQIAAIAEAGGATFVDGGIVGGPPRAPGSTRVYLSGPHAGDIVALLDGTVFGAVELSGGVGAASALKACYAGWTKTTNALILAVRATAVAYGVEDALLGEWARSQPDLVARSEWAAAATARKAWRYTGEMEEHAATFGAVGVPGGFHGAAAEVFERLAGFKDAPEAPTLPDVLAALRRL